MRGDRHDRWQRVIDGAVAQSRQGFTPQLRPLASLKTVLVETDQTMVRWICVPGAPAVAGTPGPAAVLVGPEGGWSDAEYELIGSRGWQAVDLGSLILRSSTAAVRGSVELVQWRDGCA